MKKQPTFWRTLRLLLGAARKRSTGRQTRQQELLSNRSGKNATDWGGIGFVFAALFMVALNVAAAFVLRTAITSAQRVEAKRHGKIVVSRTFLDSMTWYARSGNLSNYDPFSEEAKVIARDYGGSKPAIEHGLREAERTRGSEVFVASQDATPGLSALATSGPFAPMIGSLVLLTVPLLPRRQNAMRVDLHPYEEAEGFKRLLEIPGYDVAALVEESCGLRETLHQARRYPVRWRLARTSASRRERYRSTDPGVHRIDADSSS